MWKEHPDPDRPATMGAADLSRAGLVDTTMLYAPAGGGVKRYLQAKTAWLARRRPQVRHSLVLPGPQDVAEGEVRYVQSARLPFGGGYRYPTNLAAWRDRLQSERPDLIEAQDPYLPGRAAIWAGRTLGVPVIGFCHSDPATMAPATPEGRTVTGLRRLWAHRFRSFDKVVAPSRYMAGLLGEAGLTDVAPVPLGVDLDVFHPQPDARARLRRALGLGARERLLVFAGRPAPEKRLGVLIQAVRRLGGDYRLLLVGADGPRGDQVLTLPYQTSAEALSAVLAGCDALVHANPFETLGLVVLEAMACGLPIVGVDHGGVGETVDPAVGVLVQASTPADLAAGIEALFAQDLEALGSAARARALARHGWDRTFDTLTRLYAQLSGRRAFLEGHDRMAVRGVDGD